MASRIGDTQTSVAPSISGRIPDLITGPKRLVDEQELRRDQPADGQRGADHAGDHRLEHERQLGSPTGRPDQPHDRVSVRRVYAATCTMLEISSSAANAWINATMMVAFRMPLSRLNNRSRNALWSATDCTPGLPSNCSAMIR